MPRQGALWPQGHEHWGTEILPGISAGHRDSAGSLLFERDARFQGRHHWLTASLQTASRAD